MTPQAQRVANPWITVRTLHDFNADEVASALQKTIRRGQMENSLLLACEMTLTSAELEEHLWSRLCVISVEDVGTRSGMEPVIVESLYQMHRRYERAVGDRFLFAAHAVRLLVGSTKDRTTDEMANWAMLCLKGGKQLPVIPDVALDMHTRRGRELGRGHEHFLMEGALVENELPGRDLTYRNRLLEAIKAGDLS